MVTLIVTLVASGAVIFTLGATLAQSMLTLRLRREENRKRELELSILEKRSQVLKESKEISHNLEDLLFKANVQQEINNILGGINKENS